MLAIPRTRVAQFRGQNWMMTGRERVSNNTHPTPATGPWCSREGMPFGIRHQHGVAPSCRRSNSGAVPEQKLEDHAGPPVQDPHAALERALIAEFLSDLGQTLHSIGALPRDQRRDVLRFAATYATLRLSEIEARARYVVPQRRRVRFSDNRIRKARHESDGISEVTNQKCPRSGPSTMAPL